MTKRNSIRIATLALCAVATAGAQMAPQEAHRARHAQVEEERQAMRFFSANDLKHVSWNAAWLLAVGTITPETPALFENILAQNPQTRNVYFASPGGDLISAMELGYHIRQHQLNTYAIGGNGDGAAAVCMSACVYAFAGGVKRDATAGAFEVHPFYSVKQHISESDIQAAVALVGEYLDRMGVSRKLLDMASLVAPDEMKAVPLDQAREWRLVTSADVARTPRSVAEAGDWVVTEQNGSVWYVIGNARLPSGFLKVWSKRIDKNGGYCLVEEEFSADGRYMRLLQTETRDSTGRLIYSSDQQLSPTAWDEVPYQSVGRMVYERIVRDTAARGQ